MKDEDLIQPTFADTDESLLEAGRLGDGRALGSLFERHRAALSAFVTRRLGAHRDWAEDVLQDVFLTLYCTTRRYEGRSAVRTWMHGIARNLCRERLRAEARSVQQDDAFAALPDASLDPLQALVRSEREALLRAAVAGLSGAHRRILRLRDRENLSYEEIARALGIPVGTVRSRVHNARAALARAIASRLGARRKKT